MEKDFVECMIFVTFLIVLIYIIFKSYLTTIKLPFHIQRSIKINLDNDNEVVPENLSFNGIPATIYQSYDNNTNVNSKLVHIINNNVSNNDEFEYYLFNNADSRLFIEQHFEPNLLNIYDSLTLINKNNLWKYCILYKNGGIYMDINLELNEKLIDILSPMFNSLPKDNNIIFTMNDNLISNKLIISPPGLPIFKELIDSYLNNNIETLTSLINKYNYKNNIKFYVDDKYIKTMDNDKICFILK